MFGWLGPWIACTVPDPKPGPTGPPPAPHPVPESDTADSAVDPTPDTDTGEPPLPVCDALPSGPFTWAASSRVHTEEDFDFDRNGLLVMQSSNNLVGVEHDGNSTLLAASVGIDIAGVRTLPSDDYVVAQQDTAALRRVNHANGNTVTVLGGLDFPNGLDVGTDGMVYVSEYADDGRVRMVDPYTGDATVILRTRYPNGLALSPDEQTLYVALSQSLFYGNGRVIAIDREPGTGEWIGEERTVFDASDLLDAITVDVCGNVYVTGYNSGKVWRIRMPDETPELLVDLPNSGYEGYCAARFGAGYGDWSRTTLYVSDRTELYAIELGVEGRNVLAEP